VVLGDEALLRLHRVVRLGGGVRHLQLQLLAEHALLGPGRDALDERVAGVEVLDGELPALQLVLALLGVGAGARHRHADAHHLALHAGRPGAERRVVGGERHPHVGGQRQGAGDTEAGAQQRAPGRTEIALLHGSLLHWGIGIYRGTI